MTKFSQSVALCLSSLVLLPCVVRAQAAPAAVGPRFFQGFTVPSVAGTLRYSLNASERLIFGYNGTNSNVPQKTVSQTNLFGDLGYLSASETSPLSVLYSGGYIVNTANQPSTFFHSLDITQMIQRKHWILNARDSFRYLPETPTSGFAGLPGLGNPGFPTIGSGGLGILTPFATRIDNTASGSLEIPLTGSTYVDGTGSYSILRYPSTKNALEDNLYTVGGGAGHRFDSRNILNVDYNYRHFEFLKVNGSFIVQDVTVGYMRHWTRKFTTQIAAGPQRTSGSLLVTKGTSLDYTALGSATYFGSDSSLSADYLHTTNSGSGVTYGARSDTARVTGSHRVSRQTTGSLTFSYGHTTGLGAVSSQSFNTTALIGTAQLNHDLTEHVNIYGSYTAEHQSINGAAIGVNPLSGLVQVLGFGISYSPRPLRVGRH